MYYYNNIRLINIFIGIQYDNLKIIKNIHKITNKYTTKNKIKTLGVFYFIFI